MTADIISFDAASAFERDRKAVELVMMGKSTREAALRLNCSEDDVNAAIIRMSGDVSPALRARAVQIDLARCDKMLAGFLEDATANDSRRGSFDAAVIVLRIMQHRDRLLGLAPQPRTDTPLDEGIIRQTSTEDLQTAIDRLVGKKNRVIEGEVVKKETSDG